MSTEPMKTNQTMPQVAVPTAAFVTVGGAFVEVRDRQEPDIDGWTNTWWCRGCEKATYSPSGADARREANEHAATCRAVSPRTQILGETGLGEIRRELAALTETVRDLTAIAGEASREAVRYRERQERQARRRVPSLPWRRGGVR